MIKELLPTEPVDMLQQGDPVVQAPKQDPPYKKKVYDKLVSSFEDFKLSEDDFYKKLVSDKTYAARVHKVLLDNFEDFTKPSDKFVADITFEEPLKKKRLYFRHFFTKCSSFFASTTSRCSSWIKHINPYKITISITRKK